MYVRAEELINTGVVSTGVEFGEFIMAVSGRILCEEVKS
jgi:hypothetical protein